MNRLIEWADEMATGVPAVDMHNRAVVGLVNELHECVHRRRGVAACREAVMKLRDCVLAQIDVEEQAGVALASEEERNALLVCLNDMLSKMDDEQSNITFHGLHQLKLLTLRRIRGRPDDDEQALEEPAEAVKVFGLTLRRA